MNYTKLIISLSLSFIIVCLYYYICSFAPDFREDYNYTTIAWQGKNLSRPFATVYNTSLQGGLPFYVSKMPEDRPEFEDRTSAKILIYNKNRDNAEIKVYLNDKLLGVAFYKPFEWKEVSFDFNKEGIYSGYNNKLRMEANIKNLFIYRAVVSYPNGTKDKIMGNYLYFGALFFVLAIAIYLVAWWVEKRYFW